MTNAFPVSIDVEAVGDTGELKPVWRFFGYDEPNYTTMRDGQKLLTQLSTLSQDTVYVRCHNLLTTGDGTPALKWGSTNAYTEDDAGNPIYDWTITDRIFDTYCERGMRPLAQIGFMPKALSTQPEPYQHTWTPGGKNSISTGWAYPPKDYKKWGELIFQWVTHCVQRYGADEMAQWYWEVWNEPNIFYWRGTPEEYHALYDHAADAVKRALPQARIGGPHVAGTRTPGATTFLRGFIEHCLRGTNYATGKIGSPLDFVAFHAKGEPRIEEGHVQTRIDPQLQDINNGFSIVASYPELAGIPIIIGESDPDGCAACPDTVYPQNGYRNGLQYASYTVAAFARKHLLAERHAVNFEGAVTWAFEFEDQPWFAGFRVLSTNGVALPVLNVFRMFGQMSGRRLHSYSSAGIALDDILNNGVRDQPDVNALACRDGNRVCVLLWHYHDDIVAGPPAQIILNLSGLGGQRLRVMEYRIDADHSNAHEAWLRMGSPQQPTPEQLSELERASHLALMQSPAWLTPVNGALTLTLDLPRQAVALVVLEQTRS